MYVDFGEREKCCEMIIPIAASFVCIGLSSKFRKFISYFYPFSTTLHYQCCRHRSAQKSHTKICFGKRFRTMIKLVPVLILCLRLFFSLSTSRLLLYPVFLCILFYTHSHNIYIYCSRI